MISKQKKLKIASELDAVITMMDIHSIGSKELYKFISPLLNRNSKKDPASLLVLWQNEELDEELKSALRKCSDLLVNMHPRTFKDKRKAGVEFAVNSEEILKNVRSLIRDKFRTKKIKIKPKDRAFSTSDRMYYFAGEDRKKLVWTCRKWADFLGMSVGAVVASVAWKEFKPIRDIRDQENDDHRTKQKTPARKGRVNKKPKRIDC